MYRAILIAIAAIGAIVYFTGSERRLVRESDPLVSEA
jgi:hypothetical protein